ncbi:MAG TPA: trigger factor [Candidatus Saccharimonadales bacterium]|nr:trigger factor [Candidatus Saccharimonadales bacterium]
MQVSKKKLSDTNVQLTIVADAALLAGAKEATLQHFARTVKVQGFREGKAPLNLVEKQVSPESLQTEFLEHAINLLYSQAANEQDLRPVAQPQVKITKFAPFEVLEIEAEVEVLGDIQLPDYKKLKITHKAVKVTDKDVDEVIAQLQKREAQKTPVERAAKTGDEVWIDFAGVDAKTKEPINGADGKDYPLMLGSNTFIPGFEDNVVGIKAGEEKTFTIKFPKDYGVKALQSKDVAFTVTAKKVEELVEPKTDDALAAKVGPFKTLAELKADIKKQLAVEQETQADREFADEMVLAIAKDTKVAIPAALIDEQLDRMEQDEKQNLLYRGQTWQEHLKAEGVTEAEHRAKNKPDAEMRVKAGLVLTEIADREKITVTPEELEVRMQLLLGQYPDPQMQVELKKPEARREIASRMKSEKTLDKLKSYTAKTKAA